MTKPTKFIRTKSGRTIKFRQTGTTWTSSDYSFSVWRDTVWCSDELTHGFKIYHIDSIRPEFVRSERAAFDYIVKHF